MRGDGAIVDQRKPEASRCLWCLNDLKPRAHRRGSSRKFCSSRCRLAAHHSVSQWAWRQIEAGRIAIKDIAWPVPSAVEPIGSTPGRLRKATTLKSASERDSGRPPDPRAGDSAPAPSVDPGLDAAQHSDAEATPDLA